MKRRIPRLSPLCAAIAGAAIPLGATAQSTTVSPPVVVTATRVEQSSFDLPVSIDVINAAEMQEGRFKVNTSETLVRIPGIVAPNQSRLSSDQQISSRGFGARSAFGVRGIRLYADGIPQSMPDGQGQTGTFNLSSAERMEVMRGPFSALYGNSSGGVIQIFTKDGPERPTVTPEAYAGSFGTWRAGMQLGGQAGNLNYMLDASRFDTDGYRDHSAVRRDQFNGKLTYRPSGDTKLVVVGSWLDQPYNEDPGAMTRAQWKQNPEQVGSQANLTQNAGGSKSQSQIGAQIEHRIDERNTVQAVAYGGTRDVFGRLTVPFNPAPVIRGSGGISLVDRNFQGVDARWTHRMPTPTGALTITAGLDYEHMKDVRTGYENNQGIKGVLRRDEDNIVWNFDQYLQAEWQLGKDWLLSGGLRHSKVDFENRDRYIRGTTNPDDSGSASYTNTSPVFGVVYHLTPTVNLYANAGKGFETPTFIEMAYQPSGAPGLNFNLKPSESKNYEVGAKAFLGKNTRATLAFFHVNTDDEIVVATNDRGRTTYQNAGKTRRRGVELSVESELTDSLRGYLAYTYLDAEFDDPFMTATGATVPSGNTLPGAPTTSIYAEVSWAYRPLGFSTALEARYYSKIYVDDANSDFADAYTVANWWGGFAQRFGGWTLKEFLRVENLFDKKYIGGVSVNGSNGQFFFPAADRNYMAGVSLSYVF